MEYLGEDNILIGTIKLQGMGNIWAPKVDDLLLYDVNEDIV